MSKNKNIPPKAKKVIKAYNSKGSKKTDPNGSYTGNPTNPWEKPTQDADDM